MAYTKPTLRKKIISQVRASSKGGKPGQWSARKAQLAAKKEALEKMRAKVLNSSKKEKKRNRPRLTQIKKLKARS